MAVVGLEWAKPSEEALGTSRIVEIFIQLFIVLSNFTLASVGGI